MTPQTLSAFRALAAAGALVATATWGAQPPDVVASDDQANTAMGTQALQALTTGINNTAGGYDTLISNSTGNNNTAFGSGGLLFNSGGADNTAVGYNTLYFNLNDGNTAVGSSALYNNTDGSDNTATGVSALFTNTSGSYNTAVGAGALYSNTVGLRNVATGFSALNANTQGSDNYADGYYALSANTTGANNSGAGSQTLSANTTGGHNSAFGSHSLRFNTTGGSNAALGYQALHNLTHGSNNIGVGANGGLNLTTGSNNIDIGNQGSASDANAIRLGDPAFQTTAYVAGIVNSKITGSAVYVTASGQLGVLASSERYKTDIRSLDADTQRLLTLRPVSFHLKNEPRGEVQYGLIAEEVVKVYPELVTRNAQGGIEGVRYDELAPMLLNELQKAHRTLAAQSHTLAALRGRVERQGDVAAQLTALRQEVAQLKQTTVSLQAALARRDADAARIAMR